MKVSLGLQFFPGFYNTIWSIDERLSDYMYCEGVEWDDIEINYSDYEKDVCKSVTDIYSSWLHDALGDVEFNVEFIGVNSPQYYNYRNDRCDIAIEFGDDFKDRVLEKFKEHYEVISKRIEKNHKSYSGFISFLDDTPETWADKAFDYEEYHQPAYLACLLEYVIMADMKSHGHSLQEPLEYIAYEFCEVYPENYITVKGRTVIVDWDVDEGERAPRSEISVPLEVSDENVSDWLSDEYGWCVNSWKLKHSK